MKKESFLEKLKTGKSIELPLIDFLDAINICKEIYGNKALAYPTSDPNSILINIGGKHKIGKIKLINGN